MTVMSCEFESHFLHHFAEIAQLVEHNLAKVRVASSSLVFRSKRINIIGSLFFVFITQISTIILKIIRGIYGELQTTLSL